MQVCFFLTLWGSKFLSIKRISDDKISIILMSMALFWTLGSFFSDILMENKKAKFLVILSSLILVFFLLTLAFLILITIFLFYHIQYLWFLGAFTLVILDHYRDYCK